MAVVFRRPGEVGLEAFDLPEPGPGEVLVQAHHTCISPGTELRCLAGLQPDATPFPYIPGYAMAGEVAAAGPDALFKAGDRVYLNGTAYTGHLSRMWGGHASHAVVSSSSCLPIPDGLSTLEASLAHLAAIAHHGCLVSGAAAGDSVVVFGLGVLGQICARIYAVMGCVVMAYDVNAERVAAARDAGTAAEVVSDSIAHTVGGSIPHGPDVIADVTGNAAVMAEAVGIARDVPWDGGPSRPTTYVVQGSYPGMLPVPYQEAFLKELTLKFPRDCTAGDRARVMDLMAQGQLNARAWISGEVPPEQAKDIYRELAKRDSGLLTVALKWT
jgi:3-hydroxyethyl bacteriochlorophyllide a dehydrogenase